VSGAGYFAVEKAIRDVIAADPELSGVRVFIEADLVFAAESAPAVYIYATGREAPANEQRLMAGRRTDFLLNISLWCVAWSLDSTERAAMQRDSLIERVELALMRDRSLGGVADTLWLDGGEFISGMGNQGFLCHGEIAVKVKVYGSL
jgi:hypothetical protein